MLKNNNFTKDDDEQRLERLLTLSANIDDLSADIGLPPGDPMLTWAQNSGAEWESAVSSAIVEDGQMDDAFENYQNKISEVYDYYTQARSLLMSLITEIESPNDLAKSYGFEGDSPRTGKGLIIAISAWKDQHDFMVAEGQTPVIGDPILNQLLDYEAEIKAFQNNTKVEKEEARQAYKDKAALFSTDSKKLRILYNTACLAFGSDDDDRLGLLGFVPASEVWTPGQPDPEAPTEFTATVTQVDVGEFDFWCSKPAGVEDAKIELLLLPDGPKIVLTEHMMVEEGSFVPLRYGGISPGNYKAIFTALDSSGVQVGDVVAVEFTVE